MNDILLGSVSKVHHIRFVFIIGFISNDNNPTIKFISLNSVQTQRLWATEHSILTYNGKYHHRLREYIDTYLIPIQTYVIHYFAYIVKTLLFYIQNFSIISHTMWNSMSASPVRI